MLDDDRDIAQGVQALGRKLRREGQVTYANPRLAVTDALLRLHAEQVECLLAYWLDEKNRLLGVDEIARGGVDSLRFSLHQVARKAILANAESCVLIHNHPGGSPTPSPEDKATAEELDLRLSLIGVLVVGHYTVADEGIGDIRTGLVTPFAELMADAAAQSDGPRCPHCRRLLGGEASHA